MKNKGKLLFEKEGWKIIKDDCFPSTNYVLFNSNNLSNYDKNRVSKGLLPCRNVAYYSGFKIALDALNRELDGRKILDEINNEVLI